MQIYNETLNDLIEPSDATGKPKKLMYIYSIMYIYSCIHTFIHTLMQIYNETLKDLIEPSDATGKPKKLDVKTDAATGASCVPDVKLQHVQCMEVNT